MVLVSLLILTLPRFGFPVQSVQAQSLVELLQLINQTNRCDEEDDGNNFSSCINEGNNAVGPITQTVGDIIQTNDGENKNDVDISQRVIQLNDCDEEDDGNNVATCTDEQ